MTTSSVRSLNAALADLIRGDLGPLRDLTTRQLGILTMCCVGTGPSTVRGLAETLRLHRSSVSVSATALVGAGLLARDPDPTDHRSVLLSPTPLGCTLALRLATTFSEELSGD